MKHVAGFVPRAKKAYFVSVFIMLFFTSCFKEDPPFSQSISEESILKKEGFKAEYYLPERNIILGTLTIDSLTTKVTYNMLTKSYTNTNYALPHGTYFIDSLTNTIYSAKPYSSSLMLIYNVLDSTVNYTIPCNKSLMDCIVSNNKLFALYHVFIAKGQLMLYDFKTGAILDSDYVADDAQRLAVSKDASRVYSAKDPYQNYSIYSYMVMPNNKLLLTVAGKTMNAFAFEENTYSMTTSGEKFITFEGSVYDETTFLLKSFNASSSKVYYHLSGDGKYIVQKYNYQYMIYDATNYSIITSGSLPIYNTNDLKISTLVFPFSGGYYMAETTQDILTSEYETIIFKLNL